ncbi:sugar phosphate transport protein-like protein [Shigella flexneri 2a]|nr:sugar phosphate transport protein-like protein [Shigella flexneri 2a]
MEPVYVILNALLDSGRFTRKLILLGLSGTFSYIFGSIVATLGMGLVVDYLGWGATFIVLILSAVFAIIFTLMSRERIKLLTKYLFFESQGIPDKVDIVSRLKTYGYSISGVETDDGYKALVRAFQLHFRQKNYDGIMDAETAAILYALLEKYFPGK